jgi:hypothetical protein
MTGWGGPSCERVSDGPKEKTGHILVATLVTSLLVVLAVVALNSRRQNR